MLLLQLGPLEQNLGLRQYRSSTLDRHAELAHFSE